MNMKDKYTKDKIVAYIVFSITILSLIPVMYLGRFNHPTGDDYYYGADTKVVWDETGSLTETIKEAVKGVALQYEIWQGTYSGMFLMYLPPNIFGDLPYRFVTMVILTLLTGGIFYLFKPILCGYLKLSKELWLLLSSVVTFMCVQTVPSQGETFFWYNGSMYYTGFFAVTLFTFGLLFRYMLNPRIIYIPILAVLGIFLAGGNYVSLLPSILVVLLLAVWLAYRKSSKVWGTGILLLCLVVGLLVSAAAPGNAVRQSDMWKISAPVAVIKSLLQGLRYISAWVSVWWILAAVIMTPVLWRAFSKTGFQFRYPVIVLGLAYGIFCSMSCPTFYTMNSTGPARVVSIVYYGFMLFTFGCYVYILGYLYRLEERKQILQKLSKWQKNAGTIKNVAMMVLTLVLLASGSLSITTTGKSLTILLSGEAQAYEQEYQERMKILCDPAITEVVFQPYEHQPDMLYVGDIGGDITEELNQKVAMYFGKNSVKVNY